MLLLYILFYKESKAWIILDDMFIKLPKDTIEKNIKSGKYLKKNIKFYQNFNIEYIYIYIFKILCIYLLIITLLINYYNYNYIIIINNP